MKPNTPRDGLEPKNRKTIPKFITRSTEHPWNSQYWAPSRALAALVHRDIANVNVAIITDIPKSVIVERFQKIVRFK